MLRACARTALCAVWSIVVAPGISEGATAIRFFDSGETPRLVVSQFRKELKRITKPAGVELLWAESDAALEGKRITVRLQGACDATFDGMRRGGPIGTTTVVDGRILPYIDVDCASLKGTILPEIERMEPVLREAAIGRAIARVVAHELRHALKQAHGHEQSGLAQASLGARELLYGSYTMERRDFERASVSDPTPAPVSFTSVADDAITPAESDDFPLETGR